MSQDQNQLAVSRPDFMSVFEWLDRYDRLTFEFIQRSMEEEEPADRLRRLLKDSVGEQPK